MNTIVVGLASFAARIERFDMSNQIDYLAVSLYRLHLLDDEESWKVFEDDKALHDFLVNKTQQSSQITNLGQNKYPKGLVPLEDTFTQ